MACGKKLDRRHWVTGEMMVVGMNGLEQEAEVNVPAFQHGSDVWANRFYQLHLHLGKALGVPVQKSRKHGLDLHWRGRHLQHAYVPVAE